MQGVERAFDGGVSRGVFGGRSGGLRLPSGYIFRTGPDGVDTVGLSIVELYPLVDPTLQSIISADGGATKRASADIVTLALASAFLNTGTMIGSEDKGIVLYPLDTPDTILLSALRYIKFVTEPLYLDGEHLYFDNSAIYIGDPA